MSSWKITGVSLGVGAGALMVAALSASPAYAWTDNGPSGASQCTNPSINSAGTATGDCLVNSVKKGFVRELSTTSTLLAPLAQTSGGAPCGTTDVNNAAQGSEIIVGWCADANLKQQGVFWNGSAPGTAPTLLQPLLLAVQTVATAVSAGGAIVGVSIDGTGTKTPVAWSPSGIAAGLNPPGLSSNSNCVPADISDAATPSIVGNCPNSGAGGVNQAVLWVNTSTAYLLLRVPTSPAASYCMASKINLSGQILGDCTYPDDSHSAVVWAAGGASVPTVLATVGGTALRTFGVDINDSGMVACDYLAAGAASDLKQPCSWNPAGGPNAAAITLPSGATGTATTTGIGNNGVIVGFYELPAGVEHPFYVLSGSTSAVDNGSPEGGPNTYTTAISTNGAWVVGVSEDSNQRTHVVGEAVP
jgi:uncharacterized membrane protein